MRIACLAVGRLKDGPEAVLAKRYHERATALGRNLSLGPLTIHEIAESRARRPEDRKSEEAGAIAARLTEGPLAVLDETGEAITSEAFARMLAQWRDCGAPAASFVIGGADGLDGALRARAAMTLSFGRMTMPHQIVRVLLLEQLYRAMTILAGHPYHRA